MNNFASNLDEKQTAEKSIDKVWSDKDELELNNNGWIQTDNLEDFNDHTEVY